MIIEDVHGLVVSAAVDRMGGQFGSSHPPAVVVTINLTTGKGQILVINDADSPPDLHLMDNFNFSPLQTSIIASIHWAATQATYTPPDLPLEIEENTPKAKNVREQAKVKRRKELYDKSREAREAYLIGDFDAVIIACQYEPYSILERITPSLAGSAAIVIHSPYLQVSPPLHLSSSHADMKIGIIQRSIPHETNSRLPRTVDRRTLVKEVSSPTRSYAS